MSVQLDIESQCKGSLVSDEGSTITTKNGKWRLFRLLLQAGNAFAATTSTNRIRLVNTSELPQIESQCKKLVVSDEGSTITAKKDKWRIIRVILQAGNAFAATTSTNSNRIRLLNNNELPHIESQCEEPVISDEGSTITVKKDNWRLFRVILQAGNAFAATTSTNRIRLLTDVELPLLSDQACTDGNVQLANISTSIEVASHLELYGDSETHMGDKEQQHANIAMIVKNKDMNSLTKFGGVKAFAEALGTDLENGLTSPVDQSSDLQAPETEFLSTLKNSCDKKILFLILLCGIMLLVIGIIEEGWETGWYEGALIICAILVIVGASLIRGYWSLCFPKIENQSSVREVLVDVLREGKQCKIYNSRVALGDIVCLNTGNEVPADGLYVRGESLRLDEESQSAINDQNPFIFRSSKVTNGKGHMLVTSVLGALMSEVTPTKKGSLQQQLNSLNVWMQYIALLINIFLIIVNFLRFVIEKKHNDPGYPDLKEKSAAMEEFIDAILNISKSAGKCRAITTLLTVILIGFSVGMPLMVTLAIGYWNKKATSNKASTQDFMACLTAGSVTAICTDILEELDIYIGPKLISEVSDIVPHVRQTLRDGIGAMLLRFQGQVSSMEQALQRWAPVKLGLEISTMREKYSIIEPNELVSNEVSGVLRNKRIDDEDNLDCHCSGPATKILPRCSYYYDSTGALKPFNEREDLETVIKNVQVEYVQSIAFAYKQGTDLIFLGIVGLKHSLRRQMKAFIDAGVAIILVSKHSEEEVKNTARLWGLVTPNDLDHSVIVDDRFRSCNDEQRIEMVDRIHILANALPSDKLLVVKCLKKKAHTVVMVGLASNDVDSMLEADVGITMGECGSGAVKANSKIVISQGDLSTLLTIVKFGRCTRENIQKFIRIELTMAIAWLLTNTISTSFFGDSPISAIQFLWICLIEHFLGGLALLTVSPNDLILEKPAEREIGTIVTRAMWQSIVLEALYQTAVLVTFQYKATTVLGISQKVVNTMIFNSFVLCQVFNWFNAREMNERSLLAEITLNCWFWVAMGVTVILQETFTETAHIVAKSARLNNTQWGICFLIGGASCVIDWLNKCISNLVVGWLPT